MKILVPVKQVIDASSHICIKPDQSGIDKTNMKTAMNPFCHIAVEEAVRAREAGTADEVIAVTIGTEQSRDVLITALAMGADRAVLLQTEQELQPLAIARLLARIASQELPQLIILGRQAIDEDNNQTGQMLAGLLGWPQGTFASKLEFDGACVNVTREIDGGTEIVSLRLPAVITTDLRLNEPRYVSLPNILKARKQPLERLMVDDLDVDVSPTLMVLKVEEPPRRATGIMVADVTELVYKLRKVAKVM